VKITGVVALEKQRWYTLGMTQVLMIGGVVYDVAGGVVSGIVPVGL